MKTIQGPNQERLRKQYDDGDTKVDLCHCGTYYLNEKYSTHKKRWIIFHECQECRDLTKEYEKRQAMKKKVLSNHGT